MAALAIGVGSALLQPGAVVHQGVIPATGILMVDGGLNQWHQLGVRHLLLVRKEEEQVHGSDVRLDEHFRLPKGKGGHRTGSVWPHPRQCLQLSGGPGKGTAPLLHHLAAGRLQVSRPPIVAQATPDCQHLGEGGRRQVSGSGKGLQPGQVLRHHPLRLGLLQHQLRNKNGIGVTSLTPGKGAALLMVEVQHHGLEFGHGGTIGQRHGGSRRWHTQAQRGIFHSAGLHQTTTKQLLQNQLHNLLRVVAGRVDYQLAEAVVTVVDLIQLLVAG